MQHVNIKAGLASYPDEEEQLRALLCPADKQRRDFVSWKGVTDGEAWRRDPRMRAACCPECGRPLRPDPDGIWLKRGNNCLYSMGVCSVHGPAAVWLRRSHLDGLHYMFARAVEKADQTALAKWQKEKRAAAAAVRRRSENAKSGAPKNGSPIGQPAGNQRRPE